MRVCILVLNNFTHDSRVLRQAETFARAGHDVLVIAVQRGDVPAQEERGAYRVIRVPGGGWTWREGYPRVAKVVRAPFVPFRRRRQKLIEATPAPKPRRAASPDGEDVEPAGAASWGRWLLTGKGEPPPSWPGGDARLRERVRFARRLFGTRGVLWRLFIRVPVIGPAAKLARRPAGRVVRGIRRRFRRRLLLPTRFRTLERRIAAEAIAFRADLYWANDVTTIRAGRAAARATGTRCAYDAHEAIWGSPALARWKRAMWAWVERRQVRGADRVFTVCEPIARDMAKRYGIERPTVVLNAPRLEETRNAPRPEDSPLNGHRGPGERIVLFHGGLTPHRGLEQLVQAVPLLPAEYRLVFLGYGHLRDALEDLARAEGVAHRVTFVDAVPPEQLAAWVAGADVGVIPYQALGRNHEYSTPNKLFECMHLGVPIVVNDLPEIRRIVQEVGFGVVCDCSDPAAIAKAIEELASDPARCAEMRARALAAAAATYSWETQEPKILSALT